ncbi:peroxidase 56-like [Cucurbita pepo subsp. pepo]|uniref:peroxidase 56-like n=1 Tax=Cucurbita pepo subsp. pepo TaxID=3664 RepID=UPI000C9D8786|nr:peroxidase 56-like [Cucurbita pepo subsp. pepo]
MAISSKLFSLLFLQLMLASSLSTIAEAHGLSSKFYRYTCPGLEYTVAKTVALYIQKQPTLAASLLRMHFHDCFVRGCDGSVLLNSTPNNQAEKDSIPNLTLRGYNVVDAVKAAVEKQCPGVVSCADILALVARDAVRMIGGPFWNVPTGRRDGTVSISREALINLPPPFANISSLKTSFLSLGLSVKDLVVLSGAHTIGVSKCSSFSNRLYNFTGNGDADPKLDKYYAVALKGKCKPNDQKSIVEMDPGSFKTFDGSYYTLVSKRRGLFQSDSALLDDPDTKAYVVLQAETRGATFAVDFAESMISMGQIGVLTGNDGEIRRQCSVVN